MKNLKIFKDSGNGFLENPIWTCLWGYYLYTAPSFLRLCWQIVTEFKHPQHFVGSWKL